MNVAEFDVLCTAACEELGLADTRALGLGGSAIVDDVLFEAMLFDGQDSFLLLADLGAVASEDKCDVYETLLTMQLAAWDQPLVRFGFHPLYETATLCVGAAPAADGGGTWLAALLKSIALQVRQWRRGELMGKLIPREANEI